MEAEVWSLCDRSMVALEPWAAAGFRCAAVDIEAPSRPPPPGVEHLQADILDLRGLPGARFVLGWPPCTHLARSGARWWPLKGDAALAEALALVSQVRVLAGDVPLVVENPIGRLSTHWRKPDTIVHPYQFAHHGPDPAADAYTKRTCLWLENGARPPVLAAWEGPLDALRIRDTPGVPRKQRAEFRSQTPPGLAHGLFLGNQRLVR